MTKCPTCGNQVELYRVPEINATRCPVCFHHVDQTLETKKTTPETKKATKS